MIYSDTPWLTSFKYQNKLFKAASTKILHNLQVDNKGKLVKKKNTCQLFEKTEPWNIFEWNKISNLKLNRSLRLTSETCCKIKTKDLKMKVTKVILASRPGRDNSPKESNFCVKENDELLHLDSKMALVKTLFLSVDPALRFELNSFPWH